VNKSLRIVVADDELDVREYLQEVLPRLGHQVVGVAQTGRELMEQVAATSPDLVITDIRMPDMDGIEASIAFNRDQQVPIILVSAHHDAELLTRAAADHIMGYLVKPVKIADLKTAITMARLRFEQFLAVAAEAANLRQALEDRKVIERAKGVVMKRLRVNEEEAFRRLRKMANDQNRKMVEVAQTVSGAEDVLRQLEKG
jgi:two-component system, response regulator PdtaR